MKSYHAARPFIEKQLKDPEIRVLYEQERAKTADKQYAESMSESLHETEQTDTSEAGLLQRQRRSHRRLVETMDGDAEVHGCFLSRVPHRDSVDEGNRVAKGALAVKR